jgi:hypothetical protein
MITRNTMTTQDTIAVTTAKSCDPAARSSTATPTTAPTSVPPMAETAASMAPRGSFGMRRPLTALRRILLKPMVTSATRMCLGIGQWLRTG